MPGWLVALLAVAAGMTVANLYYAQPLLSSLSGVFHTSTATARTLITLTQVGYVIGTLFLVPLGDQLEKRNLITVPARSAARLFRRTHRAHETPAERHAARHRLTILSARASEESPQLGTVRPPSLPRHFFTHPPTYPPGEAEDSLSGSPEASAAVRTPQLTPPPRAGPPRTHTVPPKPRTNR
ncbi:hypothetical protein ACIQGO_42385 [Streptomyces shenzhenensis]|uniref:hypothetical protein n=1 Tax=Streptomyces shenzhenensis TaxID=943815 RepID=UPI003823A957